MPQNLEICKSFLPRKFPLYGITMSTIIKATRLKKWTVFDTIVDHLCSQLVGILTILEIVVTLLLSNLEA